MILIASESNCAVNSPDCGLQGAALTAWCTALMNCVVLLSSFESIIEATSTGPCRPVVFTPWCLLSLTSSVRQES